MNIFPQMSSIHILLKLMMIYVLLLLLFILFYSFVQIFWTSVQIIRMNTQFYSSKQSNLSRDKWKKNKKKTSNEFLIKGQYVKQKHFINVITTSHICKRT